LAANAPVLHAEMGSNVVAEWRQRVGDADAAVRTADVVVGTPIRLARGGANPLEPRGLIALAVAGSHSTDEHLVAVRRGSSTTSRARAPSGEGW
jgi:CO/xanthine dehydrogenase Mo-binding subunit